MPDKLSKQEYISESSKGSQLVSDAARLMHRCAGYISDQQAIEQNERKIFYAVDVDIVKLYMAPKKKADYAKVFSDGEDEDTREILARLIGDFIFNQIESTTSIDQQQNNQLFIIPPHDDELTGLIHAISNRLVDDINDAEVLLNEIDIELLMQFKNGDRTLLGQWLIDNAPLLIEIFDGKSGPKLELDRFEALGEHQLLNIERYKEDLWTFPLPLLDENPEDFKEFSDLFKDWKILLSKHKSSSQKHDNLIRDAYVMTTLEWLNQRMYMEEDARSIVLITGTKGLLNAALDYHPSWLKKEDQSFADLFLRHPQAFMADNKFFYATSALDKNEHTENFNLFSWLNLFFPKAIREGVSRVASINIELLNRIENSSDEDFKAVIFLLAKNEHDQNKKIGFPMSMIDEWRTQIRSACLSKEINKNEENWSERAKQFLEWLTNRFDQEWTIDQLRAGLTTRAIESLSALYSSTVWLGLWRDIDIIVEHVRGIPALRFDPNYEQAQGACEIVVNAMRYGDGLDKSNPLDIEEIYHQLSLIDDSNYHGHVIHALAYATKGHWYAARTLCKIALKIADGLEEDKKNFRTGREAAYLLAVTERRLARNIEDLNNAEYYLQEAFEKRKDLGTYLDPRFLSEAIAIDVAKINFQYFINDDDLNVETELLRIWQRSLDILDLLETEELLECNNWIKQQIYINFLDLTLISYQINQDLPDKVLKSVQNILSYLQKKMDSINDESINDNICKFIFLIAASIFSDDTGKNYARNKLVNFNFYPSLPFDEKREKLFRELALKPKVEL